MDRDIEELTVTRSVSDIDKEWTVTRSDSEKEEWTAVNLPRPTQNHHLSMYSSKGRVGGIIERYGSTVCDLRCLQS